MIIDQAEAERRAERIVSRNTALVLHKLIAAAILKAAQDATAPHELEGLHAPVFPAGRCRVCGWPLAETISGGCVSGNCSQRPAPKVRADAGYAPEVL